ncbi:hypothetical protein ZWY2020_029470 [Hordeum vulgare]|nr:hypothetical protein ZWY2020_029470 [Hordeum vulgare]
MGVAGFEEVTHLIDHYFREGVVGVSSEKVFSRLVLSQTQSQSVGYAKQVTRECMVQEQVHAYEFKRRNNVMRFENNSEEYEDKEKLRRVVDAAKGAKYGKAKQHDLEKKSVSSVSEQDGTPRSSPHVTSTSVNDLKRK